MAAAFLWTFIGLFAAPVVHAADGSGTAIVSPTSVNAGSTGNAMTFTFTAAEAMNSGGMMITAPSGWSAPQGTVGVAGYTTATSAGGTIATVLDSTDSLSGWSAGTACASGLTIDTSVKQEGTGSVSCANGAEANGDRWYKNVSAQDWSGYTKVAFWIRSDLGISATNRFQFAYDNDANLATPIELINIPQTVTANTWTYLVINFGATTRTSVTSFGFVIQNAELQNSIVRIDDILLGPGVPSFPGGGDIRTRFLQLSGGQTVTVTYGAGGGTSGATAPASGETSVFTTQTRISDAGTLTSIASSPIVTVFNPAPTTTSISPTSRAAGSGAFTITVNGTNFVPASVVRFNGSDRATTYVNATQLTASILAGDVTAAGTPAITVFSPTPGGGTSNAQTLTVTSDVTAPSSV
ncbi:MAG TPA: hypothetical protein VL500_01445, partial [Candidatus Eisenbacteria bacterium]|nr:hypothetical protein [Candidatus Eisenbacteria bacterium]